MEFYKLDSGTRATPCSHPISVSQVLEHIFSVDFVVTSLPPQNPYLFSLLFVSLIHTQEQSLNPSRFSLVHPTPVNSLSLHSFIPASSDPHPSSLPLSIPATLDPSTLLPTPPPQHITRASHL